MPSNPLRLLSKLRRFDSKTSVEKYLTTEMRQNFKAIEDALRSIGSDIESQGSGISTINSSIPYSLYCLKTGSMQSVTSTEATLINWDAPTEEIGDAGEFDSSTGLWTCNRTGTYLFFGRCGVAFSSSEEINVRLYVDSTCYATAINGSIAKRGPIASFGKRITAGQVVKMTVQVGSTVNTDYTSIDPIFFNVVQSGIT